MSEEKEIADFVKKCRCCMTEEEKKEDSRLKRNAISRRYYERNKDKLREKHKQYYNDHYEQIVAKVKEWQEANKELVLEKKRKYYEEHKNEKQFIESIRRKQLVICDYCKDELTYSSYSKHLSRKHPNEYIKLSNENRRIKYNYVVKDWNDLADNK